MKNRVVCFALSIVFLASVANVYSEIALLKSDNYSLSMEPYLRTDIVSAGNITDLNSDLDDSYTYLGIDYHLSFDYKYLERLELFLKVERNGPFDLDAPIVSNDTIATIYGPTKEYRGEELLPLVEEYWADVKLSQTPVRAKVGLFSYGVGNTVAIGGYYENYGASIYGTYKEIDWTLHYERPDLVQKIRLGPKIQQEEDYLIEYNHTNANLISADALVKYGAHSIQPYLGVLIDNTSFSNRYDVFATPTSEEYLGTIGFDLNLNFEALNIGLEAARNFGEAKSDDSLYPDVTHKGWLIFMDGAYAFEKWSPRARFIMGSENKIDEEDFLAGIYQGSSNSAFSIYSPLNMNLFDTLNTGSFVGPMVYMAKAYGVNGGVWRPGTFADPYGWNNLIMPNIGFDFYPTQKIFVSLDYWYVQAKENGIGSYNNVLKDLSKDLGQEIDLYAMYTFNERFNVSLSFGYFIPGDYYKEKRDDLYALFSPLVRGDGDADNAYQLELRGEVKF